VILHGGLFLYDLTHPQAFLNTDHGSRRLRFIEGMLDSSDSVAELQDFVTSHWIIGDYAFQGVVYAAVGHYGLILFQIAVTILSIYCVYGIALLLSESRKLALVTALVYMLLPHTLVYPHLLSSEAMFVPLVVFSFFFMAHYLLGQQRSLALVLAGLMIGLATIVRPVSLFWPVMALAIAVITLRSRFRIGHWSGFLLVSVLPLLLWMLFMLSSTGEFSMGKGSASLGSNLYTTVEFISETLPPAERARVQEQYVTYGVRDGREKMGIGQYLRFATEYPVPYLEHQGRAALMFFAKSGINKLTKSYLQVSPQAFSEIDDNETRISWRARLEQEGLVNAFVYYYQRYAFLVITASVAGALFAALVVVAIYGAVVLAGQYWRERYSIYRFCMYSLLVAFPCYIFLASLSSQRLQSRHRAPAEFAIAILFGIGAFHLVRRLQRMRVARKEQSAAEL
jgi:4-amino-4-deoxy-L-arabinose transferase-like glycosyltransferase